MHRTPDLSHWDALADDETPEAEPTDFGETCRGPDCERDATRFGLCWGHAKQHQRGQTLTALAEKVTPEEAALVAAEKLVNASAEDDGRYQLLRKSALATFKRLGRRELAASVKAGMAEARAKGTRLGRPPKVTGPQVEHAFCITKSVTMTAQLLGVSRKTISNHLRAAPRKRRARPQKG